METNQTTGAPRPTTAPKQGADLNQLTASTGTLDTTARIIPVTFYDFTKKGGRK